MRIRLKDGRWAPVQKLFEFFEKNKPIPPLPCGFGL